jgi:excisionase family DNA binding protein
MRRLGSGVSNRQYVSQLIADRLTSGSGLSVGRVEVAGGSEPLDDVLTLAEAATLLKVSVDTVQRAAEADTVPARRLGGEWRFSRHALLAWLGHEASGRREAE